MKEFEISTVICAPKRRVWEALTAFESYALWNPIVTYAKGSLVPGKFLTIEMQNGGATDVDVLIVENDTRFVLSRHLIHRKLIHMNHHFELDGDTERTTFTQKWECSGLLVPPLWNQLTRQLEKFEEFNLALKRRVETSAD